MELNGKVFTEEAAADDSGDGDRSGGDFLSDEHDAWGPVIAVTGKEDITQEEYDKVYKELNLDKTVIERFGIWLWDAVHLDFGTSYSITSRCGT
jgi:ABC-type microcin C transport system permease subunit YejB